EVTPAEVTFGYVPVGQRGMLDVIVRNTGTGNALLEISNVAVRDGASFSVAPVAPPALVLGPRGEQHLTVSYRPMNEGVHLDALLLRTNDPMKDRIEIPLRGTSVQGARASVTPPGPIDLGDVHVGNTKDQVLTLSNQGGAPLEVQALSFSGPGAASYAVTSP